MEPQVKVSHAVPKSYTFDTKKSLLNGMFTKDGKKKSARYLYAFQNHIVISKDGKKAQKILPLAFENKFDMLRVQGEDKKQMGRLYGIKFELEGTKHTLAFESQDEDMLRRFRSYLALRINQRGFHESFKAHKKIGKGNFASVYLADRLEDQRAFAIKAFSKEVAYGQDKGKEAIKNEIELMRQLDCSSLIRLHEVYETENSLYMVLDLLEGGSLYDKIKHRPTFNHKEIEILMRALMEGLAHMHTRRIMHRDLKPENILFRKTNVVETVCIADFGLATNADEEQYLFIRCGTPGFVAPEVVNCKETHVHYEPVCDVFSMGLIFYILLTGKPAFPGKSYNDVLVKNRKCEIILNGTLFDNIPSTSRDLLDKMLQRDPTKRITAQQALHHPYFATSGRSSPIQNMDDGIIEDEEGESEGSLGSKLKRLREEQINFDMARINQLQNSPINSPIIAATSRFNKLSTNDGTLVMGQPLMTGNVDSIQGSPEQTNFNSPSGSPINFKQMSSLNRPSKFKDGTQAVEQDQSQQGARKQQVGSNNNPLHKYAIQQQMTKQSQEESKQQVLNVKNQLRKFE